MSVQEPVMDAVEKVARVLVQAQGRRWKDQDDDELTLYYSDARFLIAAFPQLALEGREEWEYAQAIPAYGFDDEQDGWHVGKSFGADSNRALDEGYTLVRRPLGPWSEVQS